MDSQANPTGERAQELTEVLKRFYAEKKDWKRKDYNAYSQAIMDIEQVFATQQPQPTNPEWTELDSILASLDSNPAIKKWTKKQILQWHTTLVEQAVLEARISERCLPRSYNIDTEFSNQYKNGFHAAVSQVEKADTLRIQQLKSQQAGKEIE